jgi:hypothetical protein
MKSSLLSRHAGWLGIGLAVGLIAALTALGFAIADGGLQEIVVLGITPLVAVLIVASAVVTGLLVMVDPRTEPWFRLSCSAALVVVLAAATMFLFACFAIAPGPVVQV